MNLWMKKNIVFLLLIALLAAGCAGNSENQNSTPPSSTGTVDPQTTATAYPPEVLITGTPAIVSPGEPAGSVLASSLVNFSTAGPSDPLAYIQGLVFNAESGQLKYLVVDTSGPDQAQTLFLPWGTFQVVTLPQAPEDNTTAPAVYMNVDTKQLAGHPEINFEELAAQESRDPAWDAGLMEFWANQGSTVPITGDPGIGSTSDIVITREGYQDLNLTLQNSQGEQIAMVKDLVINEEGAIRFAMLDTSGWFDLSGQWVPIPWNKLTWLPEEQRFQADLSEESLENAPRFDPSTVPAMTAPGFDQDWIDYWESQP